MMKAGFLFTNRTAAQHIITEAERRRVRDKPPRPTLATMADAVTRLFSR